MNKKGHSGHDFLFIMFIIGTIFGGSYLFLIFAQVLTDIMMDFFRTIGS